MDFVQVVFLCDTYKRLMADQQQCVIDIVESAYFSVYGRKNNVKVTLVNAVSNTNTNDIVLAIKREDNVINEADYRTKFSGLVCSTFLKSGLLNQLNFQGNIGWQDGLLKTTNILKQTSEFDGAAGGVGKEVQENMAEAELNKKRTEKFDYEKRALMYQAEEPEYTFESLCIPDSVLQEITTALDRIKYERAVFEEWGLKVIMPSPSCALSFFGMPGTGKSLAADAIAAYLGKKIIRTSYADIENKYVGEGPKNVSAVFLAAENQDAVLLIDEADSLLSKRLINVQEASGQAINSMRSQLLISLEHFHGIVIFTTNMIINYDAAFISRLINIEFKLPDKNMRVKIWKKHLLSRSNGKYQLAIPLDEDVNLDILAEFFELSGRDIRNAVVDACVTGYRKYGKVTMECLMQAAKGVQEKNKAALSANDHTTMKNKIQLSDDEKKVLSEQMQKKVDEKLNRRSEEASEV